MAEIKIIGRMDNTIDHTYESANRVYDSRGNPPAITAASNDHLPKIVDEFVEIKQATSKGSVKCKVGGCYDSSYPSSKTRRGRVQDNGDVTPAITTVGSKNINFVESTYRIRKLTPKECWRLMGYTDEDFDYAKNAGVSNSQLYKQAGNAIVKQVLMAIFKQML